MNSSEITQILKSIKSTKNVFVGVFACNILPNKVRKLPALLICNTQPINEPGQHWIAIYISKCGHGEYFDSFGLPHINKYLINFLETNWLTFSYNKAMIQSVFSYYCGHFCILYAFFKSRNKSLSLFF